MPQYDQVPCKDTPVGAHFITQHLSGIAAPSASKPADVSHFQAKPVGLGFSSKGDPYGSPNLSSGDFTSKDTPVGACRNRKVPKVQQCRRYCVTK